jgi:type IV secretory pathway VirB2 component (pilin)
VNEWAGVFLAVMAVSLAVMATIQIGLIIVGIRVAKQVTAATTQLHEEIRPLIQKANLIADDAARATALAALQVERVDQFMAASATRLDNTLAIIQNVVSGPVGQGAAVLSAFKAVMGVMRDWKARRRASHHHDEDDALFVG